MSVTWPVLARDNRSTEETGNHNPIFGAFKDSRDFLIY